MNAASPQRFKLTVGMEDLRFNYSVQVDTMFLHGLPVFHMVDAATHFCAASFLRTQATSYIWKKIQIICTLVYLGPPDYLNVDQGSSYVSKEMISNLEESGTKLKEAPVENPGTIGVFERYYAPLRSSYTKIRTDMDKTTSDSECLRMAFLPSILL